MAQKSKILIVGGTGYIGKFVVEASIKSGNPTFLLVRESAINHPEKSKLLDKFKSLGATLLIGDMHDHDSLVKAIKQVDVVISTVGGELVPAQVKLISAIKEAGNVKRFLPSEFGTDVDHVTAIEPAKSTLQDKVNIRRAVEASGIPYTFVSCNGFAGYFLPTLGQMDTNFMAPREKVTILGDGNPKAVFVSEDEIGLIAIKAVDDPRTCNKTLIFRPPGNTMSYNEIVSVWESKIGKTLEKTYLPEELLLKQIQEVPFGLSIILAIMHSVFINGCSTNFEIEPSFGVEASELYPDFKFTSIDEYLTKIA